MNWDPLKPYWPAILIAGLLMAAAAAIYFWIRKRPGPEEVERRRRAAIEQQGKMGDGMTIDISPDLITYSYSVRGIEYQATQDISGLQAYLPSGFPEMIGPVGVKYDPRNPANSIVISEQWSGLRKARTNL